MRTNIAVVFLLFSFFESFVTLLSPAECNAQVIVKERVSIFPDIVTGSYRKNPRDTPPNLFIVAPRSGLMQFEISYGWKLNSAIPSSATFRVALPETTYTTTVTDFFNRFTSFPVYNTNICQSPPTSNNYVRFSDMRNTPYPFKLLFIRVPRPGDTLRFTLHDGADIPSTTLSGDSSTGWTVFNSIDPPNVQCWSSPDNQEATSAVLKFADTAIAGFRVKGDYDTVFYGHATPVRVTAINSAGNEVYYSASNQISLSYTPTIYGRFINAAWDTVASPITQNYSDARNGKVWYVSDPGRLSDSVHPITLTAKNIQDTSKHGTGTVTIKNEWTIFNQWNTLWRDSAYDFEPGATIWGKGCALTCFAMILKRYGYNVTPGTLNSWMKNSDHLGFDPGGNVHWVVPEEYSGGVSLAFMGLVANPNGSPLSLSVIDNCPEPNWSLMAQVDDGASTHYIIIVGKNLAGEYVTLDPIYSTPRTLVDYGTPAYPHGRIRKLIKYWKN